MSYVILALVGFVSGLLSGSVGFGGGMILLPVITYFYGVDIAVPVSTLAQMLSNLSRAGMGFSEIKWKKVGLFLLTAAPLTALGALGFAKVSGEMKPLMTRILCVCLIIFAVIKITGKIRLPKGNGTVLVGGGITGFVNGMLGISGLEVMRIAISVTVTPSAYETNGVLKYLIAVLHCSIQYLSGRARIFLNSEGVIIMSPAICPSR